MRARENKCHILQNDILHTKFSEIDLCFHNSCEIWRLNYSGTKFLSTDNKNYSISCDGFRLNIFKASRLHYYLTLLITAVFFFHAENDNSSEGNADDGGGNVDAVDDDIDDFIDNAVAIVVLLVMSRMKVIG